ncbi:helix-turn-helix transcriptional regulator [Nocardia sp. BMG51109]|uniref:helix-turn-helix domain-containing protein n=1 Tax=Nocardia sp. BMG51109 TaxID=1056816 RepID=UPI000465D8E2|nr:helix-turn-helix transcriptional regulator [Nocardia sp. BMG51109]
MAHSTGSAFASDEDDPEDPALLRRILGVRLRKLRLAAGIKGDAAGRAIRASHSKISRLEAGLVGFRTTDVEDLLTCYGIDDPGTRAEFVDLAQRARTSGRWHLDTDLTPRWLDTYLALEDSATLLRTYAPGTIPHLLQTPDYAREVFGISHPGCAEDIQRRVEVLEQHQRLLTRADPPRIWVVVEQAALRRQLGGRTIWGEQLDHLARAAEQPNISVQIMPDHAIGPAISTVPFTVLRFGATDLPDIVHVSHATGAQFLDKRGDVDIYHALWDRLCVKAIPPERTSDLVTAAADGAPL